MRRLGSKFSLKFLVLIVSLVFLLGLYKLGKSFLASWGLREIAANLTARIVTVTPSPTVVVQRLQALNRLETARMVSQHIVEASSNSTWLPSFLLGERLLLIAQVEIIAGVDMSKISPDDVKVNGDKVVVSLPAPKILSARIDESGTKVFAREKGWLIFNPDKDLERQARLQALSEAKRAALQSELLPFAQKRAEENLRNFLHSLGFKQVEIQWRNPKEIAKAGEGSNG
ncbi:MAG: DUF4230 domain-containing protein [Armatimonadota bacterium]|nr:DUF4230 domain-containing protein [Armatimonadota bacterium]